MRQVRLTKNWNRKKTGLVMRVTDSLGDWLTGRKIAEPVAKPTRTRRGRRPEAAAVAAPENAATPASQPRG